MLDRLPDHLRGFLVQTSVLRTLTPPVCDALLERLDSAAVLEQLARAGLFVAALDDTWGAYGVHPLFRDVLASRLHVQEPAAEIRLHRRAAAWFTAQGEIAEAVEHLLAAGEQDQARVLLVEHWVPLSNDGGHSRVWRWLGRLPSELVVHDAQLCVMAAWSLLNERHYAQAEAWLERLGHAEPTDKDVGTGWWAEAHGIRSHAHRHRGDVDAAVRAGRDAVALTPTGIICARPWPAAPWVRPCSGPVRGRKPWPNCTWRPPMRVWWVRSPRWS